jgi:hypothetical protein
MKMRVSAFLCAASMFAAASLSQPADRATWLGVWQGELDGQPSVVLTLADDTGELGGTVVLNIIQKEDGQAHIIAKEPHVLLNPRVDGDALAFQFKKLDGGLLDFTIKLAGADKATIHCLNCGPDAPTVDLARAK